MYLAEVAIPKLTGIDVRNRNHPPNARRTKKEVTEIKEKKETVEANSVVI